MATKKTGNSSSSKPAKVIKNKAAQERDAAAKRQEAASKKAEKAKKAAAKADPSSKPPTKKATAEEAKAKAEEKRANSRQRSEDDKKLNRAAYELMNDDPQYTTLAEARAAILSQKTSSLLGENEIEPEEDTVAVDPSGFSKPAAPSKDSDEGLASTDYNDELSQEVPDFDPISAATERTKAGEYDPETGEESAAPAVDKEDPEYLAKNYDAMPKGERPDFADLDDTVKKQILENRAAAKEAEGERPASDVGNYEESFDQSVTPINDPERKDAEAVARYIEARDSVVGKPATRLDYFKNAHENTYRAYERIAAPSDSSVQGALDARSRARGNAFQNEDSPLSGVVAFNKNEAEKNIAALPAPEMVDTGNAEADKIENDRRLKQHNERISKELEIQDNANPYDTILERPGMPAETLGGTLRLGRRYEGTAAYSKLPQVQTVRTQNELRTRLGQIGLATQQILAKKQETNPEANTVSGAEASQDAPLSQILSSVQMGGVVAPVRGVGKGPALGDLRGNLTDSSTRRDSEGKPVNTLTDPDYAAATAVTPVRDEEGNVLSDSRTPLSPAVTLDNPLQEPEPARFADTRLQPAPKGFAGLVGVKGGFMPITPNIRIRGGDSNHPMGESFLEQNAAARKAGLPEPHKIVPNEDFQLNTPEGYAKESRFPTDEETTQLNAERVSMFEKLVEGKTPKARNFQPVPGGVTSRDYVQSSTPGQTEHWPMTRETTVSTGTRRPIFEMDKDNKPIVVNGRRVQAKDSAGKPRYEEPELEVSSEEVEDWNPANNVSADFARTSSGNVANDERGRPIVNNPGEVNVIAGPGHLALAAQLQDAVREHNEANPGRERTLPTGAQALQTVVTDSARNEEERDELVSTMESYEGRTPSIDQHGEATSENAGKKSGKRSQDLPMSRIDIPNAPGSVKGSTPTMMVDPLRRTTPDGKTAQSHPDEFDENGKFIDRNALIEHLSPDFEAVPAAPLPVDTGRKRKDSITNKALLENHAKRVAEIEARNAETTAQRLRLAAGTQIMRTNNPADARSTAMSEVPGVDSDFDFGSLVTGGDVSVDTKNNEVTAPKDRYAALAANRQFDPELAETPIMSTQGSKTPITHPDEFDAAGKFVSKPIPLDTSPEAWARANENVKKSAATEAETARIERYGTAEGRKAAQDSARAAKKYKTSPEGRKEAKERAKAEKAADAVRATKFKEKASAEKVAADERNFAEGNDLKETAVIEQRAISGNASTPASPVSPPRMLGRMMHRLGGRGSHFASQLNTTSSSTPNAPDADAMFAEDDRALRQSHDMELRTLNYAQPGMSLKSDTYRREQRAGKSMATQDAEGYQRAYNLDRATGKEKLPAPADFGRGGSSENVRGQVFAHERPTTLKENTFKPGPQLFRYYTPTGLGEPTAPSYSAPQDSRRSRVASAGVPMGAGRAAFPSTLPARAMSMAQFGKPAPDKQPEENE